MCVDAALWDRCPHVYQTETLNHVVQGPAVVKMARAISLGEGAI